MKEEDPTLCRGNCYQEFVPAQLFFLNGASSGRGPLEQHIASCSSLSAPPRLESSCRAGTATAGAESTAEVVTAAAVAATAATRAAESSAACAIAATSTAAETSSVSSSLSRRHRAAVVSARGR